jgi:hypothetical protein
MISPRTAATLRVDMPPGSPESPEAHDATRPPPGFVIGAKGGLYSTADHETGYLLLDEFPAVQQRQQDNGSGATCLAYAGDLFFCATEEQ